MVIGEIDNLLYFDRALTADQVERLYACLWVYLR